jgi:hypothetical protein
MCFRNFNLTDFAVIHGNMPSNVPNAITPLSTRDNGIFRQVIVFIKLNTRFGYFGYVLP